MEMLAAACELLTIEDLTDQTMAEPVDLLRLGFRDDDFGMQCRFERLEKPIFRPAQYGLDHGQMLLLSGDRRAAKQCLDSAAEASNPMGDHMLKQCRHLHASVRWQQPSIVVPAKCSLLGKIPEPLDEEQRVAIGATVQIAGQICTALPIV
jgi:hypothetical protein